MLLALLWNPRPRGSRVARRLNICCVCNSSWRISRVPSGWTELKLRSYLSTCRSRYVTPLVSIWLCCFVHSCLTSNPKDFFFSKLLVNTFILIDSLDKVSHVPFKLHLHNVHLRATMFCYNRESHNKPIVLILEVLHGKPPIRRQNERTFYLSESSWFLVNAGEIIHE